MGQNVGKKFSDSSAVSCSKASSGVPADGGPAFASALVASAVALPVSAVTFGVTMAAGSASLVALAAVVLVALEAVVALAASSPRAEDGAGV